MEPQEGLLFCEQSHKQWSNYFTHKLQKMKFAIYNINCVESVKCHTHTHTPTEQWNGVQKLQDQKHWRCNGVWFYKNKRTYFQEIRNFRPLYSISDKCLVFSTDKTHSLFLLQKNHELIWTWLSSSSSFWNQNINLQEMGLQVSPISCFLLFSLMVYDLEFCTVLMLTKARRIHWKSNSISLC